MNVYTDPRLLDVHGAMDSLPALSLEKTPEQAQVKATGKDNMTTGEFAPEFAPKSDKGSKFWSTVGNAED